jgi:hypothetical protein
MTEPAAVEVTKGLVRKFLKADLEKERSFRGPALSCALAAIAMVGGGYVLKRAPQPFTLRSLPTLLGWGGVVGGVIALGGASHKVAYSLLEKQNRIKLLETLDWSLQGDEEEKILLAALEPCVQALSTENLKALCERISPPHNDAGQKVSEIYSERLASIVEGLKNRSLMQRLLGFLKKDL